MSRTAPHRLSLAALFACATLLAPATAAAQETLWRIVIARPAPWAPTASVPPFVGEAVRIGPDALEGPAPLACAPATLTALKSPPEGLFEGALTAPAQDAAQALGFTPGLVAGLRVTCPNAGFDFHEADAQTLLVGLDGAVLTLSSAPGALAAADTPEGVAQRLLEVHFAGDMAFLPEEVEAKAGFLSADFLRAARAWFEAERPEDEAPLINGDPFTDSQEYPTRFAVGAAAITGETADVPVRVADGWWESRLTYRLVLTPEGWRLDDIAVPGFETLREAFAADTPQ